MEQQYLNHMSNILENGHLKSDRTGTGTFSLFGLQMRSNINRNGYPLLTTKKMHTKSIFHELLWFLKGDTNTKYLTDNGVTIWQEWTDEYGNLGPIYGHQWRSWSSGNGETIDQIAQVIQQLRTNPDDRRIIVSAWNVGDLKDMALPPCHLLFQFYSHSAGLLDRLTWRNRVLAKTDSLREAAAQATSVRSERERQILHLQLDGELIPRRALSCQLYQRSCDWFLGVPFNIASYAALTMMVAQVTNHIPHEFIWTGGDCHLYRDHIDQARTQLNRDPEYAPWLSLNETVREIDDFEFDDLRVEGYRCLPAIKAPISK